ncbi:MAG: hypothetical protein ACOYLV_04975 [Rubrivivax sp.]
MNAAFTAAARCATLVAMFPSAPALPAALRRRLREVWRSAGWPCQDMVEVELLAAGLLERVRDAAGRETLRVTDEGVRVLAQSLQHNRRARSLHEALVERVALEMQRAGRIVWRGLSLRAGLAAACAACAASPAPVSPSGAADAADAAGLRWAMAMPDVYSIRHTTVEDWVEPVVHEIKVRRADLLADLRQADKRQAYLALSSQCWYVLKDGIGEADDLPPECGVMRAHGSRAGAAGDPDAPFDGPLEVLRAAPRRPHRIGFATWLALARAPAEPAVREPDQRLL